ncbi:helix-turn-helix transcriptional regulator [Streptomyces sp. MNP-20]|uniref:helix-turn-helix transcriptional regulator n=1 Tax=Streptomyces sp. MNP-20 TaxID=2721165 RepID=UPI00155570C3|nr:helix-turn-helix transcriptional regulator [Streptomyces sp. MNP-20]
MTVKAAAALATDDHRADDLFDEALAVPDTGRRPFERARVQLAYGEGLRRARSTKRARGHLGAALDTFERLGAAPWTARTVNELRATGQPVKHGTGTPTGTASLTPQQREIALLAAAGLTNKQIGERLFLSPRTVSTPLHQLFPKLGVTSRAALRDALRDLPKA